MREYAEIYEFKRIEKQNSEIKLERKKKEGIMARSNRWMD